MSEIQFAKSFNETNRCDEIEMTKGASRMVFFVRWVMLEDGHYAQTASVFIAQGTQKDLVAITKDFIERYAGDVIMLSDQVSNEHELKAMYRAGLRKYRHGDRKQQLNLAQTLQELKDFRSVRMDFDVA